MEFDTHYYVSWSVRIGNPYGCFRNTETVKKKYEDRSRGPKDADWCGS